MTIRSHFAGFKNSELRLPGKSLFLLPTLKHRQSLFHDLTSLFFRHSLLHHVKNTDFNHFVHSHFGYDERSVGITILTILFVCGTIGICAVNFFRQGHPTALTKLHVFATGAVFVFTLFFTPLLRFLLRFLFAAYNAKGYTC